MEKPFAEIIESSLHSFSGQCWQWNQMPSFGSLIYVESGPLMLYGIVSHIQTGSMEQGRYPFPYQKTFEELQAEQPQIFEFLKTTFTGIILGYQKKGRIFYVTPPAPALIHSFIRNLSVDEQKIFFASNRYLHMLINAQQNLTYLDDLLLTLLSSKHQLGLLKQDQLTEFMGDFSLLIGNDYRRIKRFMQRASEMITL